MAYTAEKPSLVPSSDVLRRTIVGWGVDLDPQNRPAVPKERYNPEGTGAHWIFPERQTAAYDRERSIEHKFLTPVFGTACPPHGVSGAIRRFAYRYSEGKTAHWLLLMLADRVDVLGSSVKALLRGRPDNLLLETGLRTEITRHGFRSRVGRKRADLKHQPLDMLLAAGTGVLAVGAAVALGRALLGGGRGARHRSAGGRQSAQLESHARGRSQDAAGGEWGTADPAMAP